jgi:UDP-GlcNAc:undecaprenyl-phosphate GlcNAc-1-phosphate transferase
VIVDRLLRGKSPFVADKRHLHHRLIGAGLSQRIAVLFIYALAFWVGSFAMAFAHIPGGKAYLLVATLFIPVYGVHLVFQIRKSRQKDAQEDLTDGEDVEAPTSP